MSFLDDQASGQIEIGGKPTVDTLTRTRRRRKRSQAPMGTETYSLLPQNEFSNIVSTPSDITQVGIGKDLLKQGTAASEVPNVFEQYVSAAPTGSTYKALYGGEDDDEPDDDAIIDELESDPLPNISPDTGIDDPFSTNFQGPRSEARNDPRDNPVKMGTPAHSIIKAIVEPFNRVVDKANDLLGRDDAKELAYQLQNQKFSLSRAGKVDLTESNQVVTPTDIDGNPIIDAGTGEAVSLDPADQSVSFDPSVSQGGGDPGDAGNVGMMASGGTVTKSKAKNKNSFMSMKGK